jgi:hypothetical protein
VETVTPTTDEVGWARNVAASLLAPLGQRWAHTLGVVERARAFALVLPSTELEMLVAAAYVHDVGYAPALARSGFHRSTARSSCGLSVASVWAASSPATPARGARQKNVACSKHSTNFPRSDRSSPTRSPTAT